MMPAIDVFRLIPVQSCMMIVNDQGKFSVAHHSTGGEVSDLEVAAFVRNDALNSNTCIDPGMYELFTPIPSISSFLASKNNSKG